MEVNIYLQKFKRVFEKIIEGNFEINGYYSNNLLKHLKDRSENGIGMKLLQAPRFSDLIFQCLKCTPRASTTVRTFVIEVFTIICENELQYDKLQLQGYESSLIDQCIFSNLNLPSPALYMASIKLARAQISHISGLNIMLNQKIWEKVLVPRIHHTHTQLAKSIYSFISKLVWTLNDYDQEEHLTELLNYITTPITQCGFIKLRVVDEDSEKEMTDSILSYLHALYEILSEMDHFQIANKVRPFIWERVIAKQPVIHAIGAMTRLPDLACLINDTLFRFYFASCDVSQRHSNSEFCNKVLTNLYNMVVSLLQKGMASAVISFIVNCNIYWSNYCKKGYPSTFEMNGQLLDVRNQFTLLLIVPLISFASQKTNGVTESVEQLSVKAGKLGSEHIIKAGYALRELNETCDKKKSVIHTLKEIFKLKGYLNETQAGLLFQALYHVLGHYILCDGNGALILGENPMTTPDDVKLLSLLLSAIRMILTEHQIGWYENPEIICLQTHLMNLLKQNILPTKEILQVIELIDLSIRKFLSPDLSLLVESKQGSSLNETGAMMKAYIQHEDWEVRDSALSLLLSCTEVAFVKYVPLQKLISENNLMVLASQVAVSDPEYYPRVTAFKCLAAATKIKCIWTDVTANHELYMHLFYTVRQSPEGMVREGAVIVLTEVYTNQKLSQKFILYMYKAMMVAALDELHWEVQLAALKFWKLVIRNHLINRGMIDGRFPAVTFSKEKRKIVVLTDKEIEKQLSGIMNDLSAIGCLTVLLQCVNDDNLEVLEQAYKTAKDLINILDFYKLEVVVETFANTDQIVQAKDEIDNDFKDIMDFTYSAGETTRDIIIDSIINTKQTELVINYFEGHDDVQPKCLINNKLTSGNKRIIYPNEFLQAFKTFDYESIIRGKKEWNSGASNLSMLLDEILNLDTNSEINCDCHK